MEPAFVITMPQAYKNLLVLSVSFLCQFIFYVSCVNLQSTLNANVGTFSLAIYFGCFMISSMLLPLIFIETFGCKYTIIISQLLHLPYIIAQFKPSVFTLFLTAGLCGLAAGPLWCAQSTYITVICSNVSKHAYLSVEKEYFNALLTRFFGVFLSFFYLAQVFGNLLTSVVLSTSTNDTISNTIPSTCGANFCPAPTTSLTNTTIALDPDMTSKVHTLIKTYFGFLLGAVVIAWVGLDSLRRYEGGISSRTLTVVEKFSTSAKLLKERNLLLMVPYFMFLGVSQSFMAAQITAAYVACAWGISHIGFALMFYGIANSITTFTNAIVIKYVRRMYILTASMVVYMILSVFLLEWTPNPEQPYVFYAITMCWGFAESTLLSQTVPFLATLFRNREKAAYNNFRTWESFGYIIAFTCGPLLCVNVQIYFNVTLLALAYVAYILLETQFNIDALTDIAT